MVIARSKGPAIGRGRRLSGGMAPNLPPPVKLALRDQEVRLHPASPERWALYGSWAESQLDTYIRNLAMDFCGLHHHIPDSRKMGEAGLPDHLVVVGHTLYLEAKRFYRGRPTLPTVDTLVGSHVRLGQETWLRKLWESGTPAYLIYPTDVPDVHLLYAGRAGGTAMVTRMAAWIKTGIWNLPCAPAALAPRKKRAPKKAT